MACQWWVQAFDIAKNMPYPDQHLLCKLGDFSVVNDALLGGMIPLDATPSHARVHGKQE